jgi:hypothetical protein
MPKKHDLETIERGLVEMVAANGNATLASERLKVGGVTVSKRTLHRWKEQNEERYESIRSDLLPKLNAYAAELHRNTALRIGSANEKLIDQLEETYKDIPARDLPGAIRNASTAKAVEVDKAQLLAGEPTQRVDSRSVRDILRGLKAKGADVEIIDAEVVSEEDIKEIPA